MAKDCGPPSTCGRLRNGRIVTEPPCATMMPYGAERAHHRRSRRSWASAIAP